MPFRRRGESDGETQGGGLCEVVGAACADVPLLPCRLGGLSPVHYAEEQGGSSVVRLQNQRLLEAFFGALQRRRLPQKRKHPSGGLHEQIRLGGAKQRVDLDGRLRGLGLIRFFEGRNRHSKEAFAGGALRLHTRLRYVGIAALNIL